MEYQWREGDPVQVSLPYGADGVTVLPGIVLRIQRPGTHREHRTFNVNFDDPLVFGGVGYP